MPLTASEVSGSLETGKGTGPLTRAVLSTLAHADSVRRLEVRANADTPEDAARARRLGAEGIGLVRTEHMFLGDRRALVEAMILARDDTAREEALAALLPLQREDFTGILTAMDALPVTIRLLDPPLHEFLPDRTDLAVRIAGTSRPDPHDRELLAAVERMHEQNPMLGLRGVRLGLAVPGLVAMQVRAIAETVVQRLRDGGRPRAEIMIPLVGTVEELRLARTEAQRVLTAVAAETGTSLDCPIGTMIELPRAALTAGRIAKIADFFSFGTNDLTQTTWGLSRDDAEASFFPLYLEKGVFTTSPFETRRAWAAWWNWPSRPDARSTPTWRQASAVSTAATRHPSTSSTGPGCTTSPAHRSGFRRRGWRRGGRRSQGPQASTADDWQGVAPSAETVRWARRSRGRAMRS